MSIITCEKTHCNFEEFLLIDISLPTQEIQSAYIEFKYFTLNSLIIKEKHFELNNSVLTVKDFKNAQRSDELFDVFIIEKGNEKDFPIELTDDDILFEQSKKGELSLAKRKNDYEIV